MNIELPDMTVEERDSNTAHSVPYPSFDMDKALSNANIINTCGQQFGWDQRALNLLKEYIPIEVSDHEIKQSIKLVLGFDHWKEVCEFVVDDMCSEFFNYALKFCLITNQKHVKEKGFIDGSGIGYLKYYSNRLKTTLEQCFDAKYFYKKERPLVYSLNKGIDLRPIANAIHPGHWSYPAGHGTKFLTAIECLNNVFELTDKCYRTLFIAACVSAHGRSGNLIHYLEDNLAGGYLTTLKEFQS